MAWAVITIVLACLIYGPTLLQRRERRLARGRTLHFTNGVCEENQTGIWRHLRHVGQPFQGAN